MTDIDCEFKHWTPIIDCDTCPFLENCILFVLTHGENELKEKEEDDD